MNVQTTSITGVLVLRPPRHGDARGYLAETFRSSWLEQHGAVSFPQENQSMSAEAGTVRGLHLQAPPRAQGKLVRVLRGAIFDVAVDVRVGSPTYGKHVGARLDGVEMEQLWVPPGFAHGFCTLEPDTVVLYKLTEPYSPDHERGLRWDDPTLAIPWPVEPSRARLSERDTKQPLFASFDSPFTFDGQT